MVVVQEAASSVDVGLAKLPSVGDCIFAPEKPNFSQSSVSLETGSGSWEYQERLAASNALKRLCHLLIVLKMFHQICFKFHMCCCLMVNQLET
jgi:hypothetical protein